MQKEAYMSREAITKHTKLMLQQNLVKRKQISFTPIIPSPSFSHQLHQLLSSSLNTICSISLLRSTPVPPTQYLCF